MTFNLMDSIFFFWVFRPGAHSGRQHRLLHRLGFGLAMIIATLMPVRQISFSCVLILEMFSWRFFFPYKLSEDNVSVFSCCLESCGAGKVVSLEGWHRQCRTHTLL